MTWNKVILRRQLCIGKFHPEWWGSNRTAPIFVTIEIRLTRGFFWKNGELTYIDDLPELGITGVMGPLRSGNAIGSIGQCHDEILKYVHTEGANVFVSVWKKYHLNGMNAACEHQEEAGWGELRFRNEGHGGKVTILQDNSVSMLGEHFILDKNGNGERLVKIPYPNGLLSAQCSVCGYKYGTAWLYRPIPLEVALWLRDVDFGYDIRIHPGQAWYEKEVAIGTEEYVNIFNEANKIYNEIKQEAK